MINSFQIASGAGSFYTFPNSGVLINKQEGFGSPAAKTAQHEYLALSGGLFISQYYRTRRISLGGVVYGLTTLDFETAKRDLIAAFTFSNATKELRMTDMLGNLLSVDVIKADGTSFEIIENPSTNLHAYWQVDLDCPTLLFYSQTASSIEGGVTVITGGASIPSVLPMSLSAGASNAIIVNNAGNTSVFPDLIRIKGPGTTFTVTNQTIGKSITLSATLIAGEYVDIDTEKHTAVKSNGNNLFGSMSGDWLYLVRGANNVTLTVASGSTSDTKVLITWRNGYISA